MRTTTGFVYTISGLLVIFVGILLTGMMLGMTTAIFSVTSLLIAPLFVIGPSLLILTGLTEIVGNVRPVRLSLIAGAMVVIVLAAWSVPRIGLRLSAWLIVEPVAVAILIAGIIMSALKKCWVSATIGSALSAPFFLFGSGQILYGYWSSGTPFTWANIWLFAPAVLLISCFVLALSSRSA
jgi:hypothetical protein